MQYTNDLPTVKAIEGSVPPAPVAASAMSNNHIYFYEGVSVQSTLNLIRQVRECDLMLRQNRLTYDLDGKAAQIPIYLHIQSYGGDLMAALGIADQLRKITTPVHSIVEGSACSAATVISMACHWRTITPSSFMMIHQFFSLVWGTYEQFKDDMKLQKMLMKQLEDFYTLRSDMNRKTVKELLKHDSWFSSKQALDAGLVDQVLE